MPVRRTKTRSVTYRWRPNGFYAWSTVNRDFYNVEDLMLSGGNHLPLNTSIDDGGPFLMHRTRDVNMPGLIPATHSNSNWDGPVTVGGPSGTWTAKSALRLSDSALMAKGATAIARVTPTNPAFDAATALGEVVTEGLPMASGSELVRQQVLDFRRSKHGSVLARGRRHGRTAGREYLAAEFAWLPLAREIQSFAKAVIDSDEILAQYRKESGRKIHRRYSFPDAKNETRIYSGGFFPDPASHFNSFGNGSMTEHYTNRIWFSGAFRYYIPSGPTLLDKFQRYRAYADRLYGVNIGPDTVWNIAPWSWAVDWFSNTGDVIQNITNMGSDSLVMQYGYVMSHQQVTTHKAAYFWSSSNNRGAWSYRIQQDEWKMRLAASPYGFGVDMSGLSPRRVAILAALGLSRT